MADFSSLPDEILLHIIDALFQKRKLHIADFDRRPIPKRLHRRNILCITAVSHKLRGIAMAFLKKNRYDIEYYSFGIRNLTNLQYCDRLSKVPFLANLVYLTISPIQVHSCLRWMAHSNIIPTFARAFPKLCNLIAKLEGSDPYGSIKKDKDAIGIQQYYQRTKFVVEMVQRVHASQLMQHCSFIHSTCERITFQLVSEITFKWMGQTVSS